MKKSFGSIMQNNFLLGFLLACLIAFVASTLEGLLPIHLIGASVIALFLGMILNSVFDLKFFDKGLHFTSKRVLKFAIILLGASLDINTILQIGKLSLIVMVFTLLTCFGGGFFIGKLLGLNWKLSNLISAGTGICGGSAIAAIAPVIEADNKDIAYAMSATFLFDMVMIIAFPFMGHALNLSDIAYGLWAGTAVNDTSSVVAASFAYSEAAGDFATMVKLTRTLSIIPVVIIFSLINMRFKKRSIVRNHGDESQVKSNLHIFKLVPWFIVGFILLSVINSFGVIPSVAIEQSKNLSKFLMVAALSAIGLTTSFKDMKQSGVNPMIHGFIISLLVVIVAIVVEYCMGMV
ncbi:MAG: YeiH family protein [Treponemataceae bacterium]